MISNRSPDPSPTTASEEGSRAMSSIRGLAAIAAIAAALVGLGACGGGSEKGNTGNQVTITLWHGQNQSAEKVIDSLVNRFNATHKGTPVDSQVGAPSDALQQKMTAALAGGKYPDMVYIFGPNVADLARSPKALDLTDAVKRPGWNWNDFYPAARNAVTVDGRIRGVPSVIDSLAVVYNKQLFAKAGIAPPKAGWTWDDYRAIAKRLTNGGSGTFGTGGPGTGDEDT